LIISVLTAKHWQCGSLLIKIVDWLLQFGTAQVTFPGVGKTRHVKSYSEYIILMKHEKCEFMGTKLFSTWQINC
jgi:hypothetical protein